MKISEFKQYAELYGSNIESWPELLKPQAFELKTNNALAINILRKEAEFEAAAKRTPLPQDDNFCQRIISIALKQPFEEKLTLKDKAMLIFIEVRNSMLIPKPAYSLAAMALIGFIVGVSTTETVNDSETIGNIFYDAEGIL